MNTKTNLSGKMKASVMLTKNHFNFSSTTKALYGYGRLGEPVLLKPK
jgi:hypothetical protein